VATLGLIVNSAARRVKHRYLAPHPFWRGLLPDESVRVTRSLEELEEAVVEFRERGIQVVAALGGDGTLHRMIDVLIRHQDEADLPMVLALAGGTMNGLPRALGTGGAPERALSTALDALHGGALPVTRRHVLRILDRNEGCTRHGFGFATGLAYRAFEEYYRSPEPGMADALRASLLPLKAALFHQPFFDGARLGVEADGAPWLPEAPHTLVASVVDNPVLWFKPFGAPLGDARAFHLVATSMRPGEMAVRLWSIFRGRCRHPKLRAGQSREVTARGGSGYLIDGDRYPAGGGIDVRLTVGPTLRFVGPLRDHPGAVASRHPRLRIGDGRDDV
jgi:hypothetical protein